MNTTMGWQYVWRNGFVPVLGADALIALRDALMLNDQRLVQSRTTEPPAIPSTADWPLEGCCAVAFCGWQGGKGDIHTVGEAEEYFTQKCYEADKALGESGSVRWFLNWFDGATRSEMVNSMITEINHNLEEIAVTV